MKGLCIEFHKVKEGFMQRFVVRNPFRCFKQSVYSDMQHLVTRVIALAALALAIIANMRGC